MGISENTRRLILAASLGFVCFVWLNWFPPFSSDEQLQTETAAAVSKTEAAARAVDFIRTRLGGEFAAEDAQTFVMFDSFADGNGYLVKEGFVDDYRREWRQFVPLDHFRVEVHVPEYSAVYAVLIDLSDGRVFGFEAMRADAGAAGAGEDAVRSLLAAMGYDADRFKSGGTAAGMQQFVHAARIGEASLALKVGMSGERVTSLLPEIRLPDAYTKWKDDQDERGAVYGLFGLMLWLGLAAAAVVILVVRRKSMAFGRGIGLALCFLIPYAIHNVNLYPGIRAAYAAEPEAALFGILFSQFITVLMTLSVYVCLVAGEGLWRGMGHRLWPRPGDPEFGGEVIRSMGRGYLLAFVVLGVQSVLFFAGSKLLGVWSVSDPLESAYNLLEPGYYPLLAWSAAISEEAVFRMFALAFFSVLLRPLARRLYRWTGRGFFNNPVCWIIPAALISGAVWALGHAGYAIYPVYTRLVEVTVLGLIFAYALLRYGFFAALFAHAIVDIIIMALQIMIADSTYAFIGLLYMMMPAAAAVLLGRFVRRTRPLPNPH